MTPDRIMLVYGIMATIALLVAAASALIWQEARARDQQAHVVQAVLGGPQTDRLAGVVGYLQGLGERFRGFYSPKNLEHLRAVIQAAGFNPHRTLPLLVGCKVAMMVLLPAMAAVGASFLSSPQTRLVMIGAGVIAGIAGPDWILGAVRRRFTAAVQRGTPDALDLLVVCSEAGMGLESALERVSQEMQHSNRAIASVLSGLLDDLRVLPNRRDAFENMATRSGVEGLQRFGTMLGQSLQYGTPLSHALRAVAAELRRERMNKLEEKAVKLPAMLIFPMIFFIMPSLYIVLLGPSFMHLYDALYTFISHSHH
jgi:tight adherence protein C